jgi:hypothetical protein
VRKYDIIPLQKMILMINSRQIIGIKRLMEYERLNFIFFLKRVMLVVSLLG